MFGGRGLGGFGWGVVVGGGCVYYLSWHGAPMAWHGMVGYAL